MTNETFLKEIKSTLDNFRREAYIKGLKEGKESRDVLGIEDVNFSCGLAYDTEYSSYEEWKKQRLERGFDNTELWNLYITILKFILPRLKAFKECTGGYPPNFTPETWEECLQKMIDSIESILYGDEPNYEGFELFNKYFFNLWY